MKLQLALDGTLEESLRIIEQVHPYVDIIEIGTPLVFREGVSAIKFMRKIYSSLEILADFKIMDAGYEEACIAFEAGADYVTVLGITHDKTIEGVLQAGQEFDKAVVVDMMQVSDFVSRVKALHTMGCHYLCVHTAFDVQGIGHTPLHKLTQLRENIPEAGSAVAGGISLTTIDDVAAQCPDIVVVGGGIAKANDPIMVARQLRERIAS